MEITAKVILKSGKDQSVRRFHPWIFSGAIKKILGEPQEGDLVEVYDNKDEFLAIGHLAIGSISVRVLSFENESIDFDFWKKRLQSAFDLRKQLGLHNKNQNNTYRLVHAEGDLLPGLIVDFYNGTAVMQMHSVGMFREINSIADALKEVYGDDLKAIYNKSEGTLPFKAETGAIDGYVRGESKVEYTEEYGHKFLVNWEEGQKTGFFIDQRENRKLLATYSSEGKKVLNMFGYTGGFSVYALRAGAELVHSVDASKSAIEQTDKNVALNFEDTSRHQSFVQDAFNFLENMKEEYDVIILDPPAFAKHLNVLSNALQGYKRLNQKALEKIKPGGILFTFSCSQVVSKENFRKSIFVASANAKRKVRVLHQLSQPADHPVSIYHPEGEYLKGLVLHVE